MIRWARGPAVPWTRFDTFCLIVVIVTVVWVAHGQAQAPEIQTGVGDIRAVDRIAPERRIDDSKGKGMPEQVERACREQQVALPNRGVVHQRAMLATAYCYTGFKTKCGTEPRPGTISVDPKVIPLGTSLYVEGYGYGVALDTGGDIKGDRLDVYFETRDEALMWGVRPVMVYILE